MRALVTGAGGFCGRHLSAFLAQEGVEVHSLITRASDNGRAHFVADITDSQELAGILEAIEPDYVFHLAGVVQADAPFLYYRVNTQYAVALLDALRLARLRECPVLLAGTSAEYGKIEKQELPISENCCPKPYNHYGISKLAQTLEGIAHGRGGWPIVMARAFNIIGPGMPAHLSIQSFASQLRSIRQKEMRPAINVGNLNTSRDFIDVGDAVKLYWRLIKSPDAYGEVVNVCSGRGTVIRELLDILIDLSGCKVDVRSDPQRFKQIDVEEHYGDRRKLERMVGHVKLTNIEATLANVLEATEGCT